MAEIEEFKQKKEEERLQKRNRTFEDIQLEAAQRNQEFEALQPEAPDRFFGDVVASKDGSQKAYYREFRKVVEAADVILEVLDARDPIGCRCVEIEKMIQAWPGQAKKIVLILNKVDLVPKEVVVGWLRFLRQSYPTLAFKASTQQQRRGRGISSASAVNSAAEALNSSSALGADRLISLLKNYSRSLDIKTSISVGVVGYPNVGKSSLINSLKRSRAVGVSSTPGHTKQSQEIHLDKNVKLIDTPGIVFAAKRGGAIDADIVLRNAVKVEQIEDPVAPVELIVKRCGPERLSELYSLPKFSTVVEFLTYVGQSRGKLLKGGIVDLEGSARGVINDWNGGKIPFHTIPPAAPASIPEFVQQMAPAFNIENADAELFATIREPVMSMQVEASEPMPIDLDYRPDGVFAVGKKPEPKESRPAVSESDSDDEINPQIGRKLKKLVKDEAKRNRRVNNQVEKSIDALGGVSLSDNYDFNQFFPKKTEFADSDDEERDIDLEDI